MRLKVSSESNLPSQCTYLNQLSQTHSALSLILSLKGAEDQSQILREALPSSAATCQYGLALSSIRPNSELFDWSVTRLEIHFVMPSGQWEPVGMSKYFIDALTKVGSSIGEHTHGSLAEGGSYNSGQTPGLCESLVKRWV